MRLRNKVEMLFAHLKRILGLGRLRLRGPCGANDEFPLAATAQNPRKLVKRCPAGYWQGQCTSIRIGQAGFCVHFLWSRSSALTMTISFRMIAVIASFLHFPVDTNCSYFAFMSGLKRVATTAGK